MKIILWIVFIILYWFSGYAILYSIELHFIKKKERSPLELIDTDKYFYKTDLEFLFGLSIIWPVILLIDIGTITFRYAFKLFNKLLAFIIAIPVTIKAVKESEKEAEDENDDRPELMELIEMAEKR